MKVGDKVIVVLNINSHYFEIGEEVELIEQYDKAWKCMGINDWWYLSEDEFKLKL